MKKITQELRGKSVVDLKKEAVLLRAEITKSILELKSNPPKDTNLIYKKRKRLAKILTLLSEKIAV